MTAGPRIRTRIREADPPGSPAASKPDCDYTVGFGKPPIASQFRKGRSGNPKGRPKGSRNIETLYREVLDMKVKTSVGGQVQTITALKAVIMKQMQKALAGDLRAIEGVIEAQLKYAETQDARLQARELGDRSLAILERAQERMKQELAAELERGG